MIETVQSHTVFGKRASAMPQAPVWDGGDWRVEEIRVRSSHTNRRSASAPTATPRERQVAAPSGARRCFGVKTSDLPRRAHQRATAIRRRAGISKNVTYLPSPRRAARVSFSGAGDSSLREGRSVAEIKPSQPVDRAVMLSLCCLLPQRRRDGIRRKRREDDAFRKVRRCARHIGCAGDVGPDPDSSTSVGRRNVARPGNPRSTRHLSSDATHRCRRRLLRRPRL